MKKILIIGSGISALSCALASAELGMEVFIASSDVAEHSQSVMAEGGINAAINSEDSVLKHAEDTLKAGSNLENENDVKNLCAKAPEIIEWLCGLGTAFYRNQDESLAQRAFGGQSFNRTCFCGNNTGKQIMNALISRCRQLEASGQIKRFSNYYFAKALIEDGICVGAAFFERYSKSVRIIHADATVIATGGLNGMFKRTTGSVLNTAYASAMLFKQGAIFRNLEFIQYHPTTTTAFGKTMLVTEAARGEGGRLYYEEDGKRIYFMEDAFGEKGNLMPRDIVARYIYNAPSQVYLDLTNVGADRLKEKLPELYENCMDYFGIDIAAEPIPVEPKIHFFMGGLAVDSNHRTNIEGLFAIGECASKYHGANRLGANSLLAGVYGGRVAAKCIWRMPEQKSHSVSFDSGLVPVAIDQNVPEILIKALGIVRREKELEDAISELRKLNQDDPFTLLAMAMLKSAKERKESRGSHFREDYPNISVKYAANTIACFDNGEIKITYQKDN